MYPNFTRFNYLSFLIIFIATFYAGSLKSQDTTLVISSNNLTLSSCEGDTATLTAGVVAAYYGTGIDGDISFSTGTNYTDGVRSTVTGSNSSGSSTLELDSLAGLTVNDEVLIITMQDDNTSSNSVGTFEFKVISSINSSTLTFTENLLNDYNASSTVKHQVIRVSNYNNVTISSGAILTSHSWDGSTGGIICFRATGQVDNSGTISVDGLGYRSPEQKAPLWRNANGGQGEGIYGLGIASGANQSGNCQNNAAWNNANGNGGGGGTGCGDSGGGGGGSYGTVGTVGINGGHTPGQPGSVVGLADLSKLVFGGAGGEGGADEDGAYPGTGGNGGGIIFVSASSITNSGTILSNGIDGNDGTNGSPGSGCGTRGGGGGAGGSIFISSSISGSGTIVAIGGDGGRSVGGCNNNNKYGGDGGNGRKSPFRK